MSPRGRLTQSGSEQREAVAAEVMARVVDEGLGAPLPAGARVLVVDDLDGHLERDLTALGHRVVRWCRLTVGDRPGAPWPGAGPFDACCLRLSKVKAAFEMALHAAASVLPAGAPLWVYGANDEGIKSAGRVMAPIFGAPTTVDARRHCRVLEARRPDAASIRTRLAEWRSFVPPPLPGLRQWVTYPGVFAKGALDIGTAELLAALPPLPGARVADFGAGSGVVAAAVLRDAPDADVHLIEADALALQAAHENVPGAKAHLSDAWAAVPPLRFDHIVSNPPFHRGKGEDFAVLRALLVGAPHRLRPGGALWMVTQRQVPVGPLLEEVLTAVEVVREDGRFRVWRALASGD